MFLNCRQKWVTGEELTQWVYVCFICKIGIGLSSPDITGTACLFVGRVPGGRPSTSPPRWPPSSYSWRSPTLTTRWWPTSWVFPCPCSACPTGWGGWDSWACGSFSLQLACSPLALFLDPSPQNLNTTDQPSSGMPGCGQRSTHDRNRWYVWRLLLLPTH